MGLLKATWRLELDDVLRQWDWLARAIKRNAAKLLKFQGWQFVAGVKYDFRISLLIRREN